MKKLISDRRLWLTEDGDQVVEEGDEDARFLLSGEGGTISAVEVERLELTLKKGRVRYPGGPKAKELGKPGKGEERAEKVTEPEKPLVFGGDKTGGAPPIDPPPEASAAKGETPGEGQAAGADDSDRNEAEALPLPEWKLKTSPAEYIEKWPGGKNAELAQRHIDAGADGAT